MFRFIFAAFIILHGGILSATPLRIEITQGAVSYTHLTLPTKA